jgi:hypothetical protein
MATVAIGPVLMHLGGYRFDVWVEGKGVSLGYPYRRIEDAHYARNAEIRTSLQDRVLGAVVCQTLDEFIASSAEQDMIAAA